MGGHAVWVGEADHVRLREGVSDEVDPDEYDLESSDHSDDEDWADF